MLRNLTLPSQDIIDTLSHCPNLVRGAWNMVPLRNRKRYDRAFAGSSHVFDFRIDPVAMGTSALIDGKPYDFVDGEPGVITGVIRTNYGGNLIPFTPWILIHRITHVLSAFRKDIGRDFDHAFDRVFVEMIRGEGRVNGQHSIYTLLPSEGRARTALIASFMTTRACRTNGLTTDFDISAELVAQRVISGKVTLRLPIEPFEFKGVQYDFPPFDLTPYEDELNRLADEALGVMVGKTLVI